MRTCTLSLLLLLIGFSAIAMPLQEEQGTTLSGEQQTALFRANFKITNRLINIHSFMHNDAISSSPDCSIAKQ